MKRHQKEFRGLIHVITWLERKGIVPHRDGSVDEEVFEEARKIADESLVNVSASMEESAESSRHCARAGLFFPWSYVCSVGSCSQQQVLSFVN